VAERERLFAAFRNGETNRLVVSKVANFAIDLPDANVLIQLSGTFGSRQEEAQRLGRILRPKRNGLLAHFYSLVTRDNPRPGIRRQSPTVSSPSKATTTISCMKPKWPTSSPPPWPPQPSPRAPRTGRSSRRQRQTSRP